MVRIQYRLLYTRYVLVYNKRESLIILFGLVCSSVTVMLFLDARASDLCKRHASSAAAQRVSQYREKPFIGVGGEVRRKCEHAFRRTHLPGAYFRIPYKYTSIYICLRCRVCAISVCASWLSLRGFGLGIKLGACRPIVWTAGARMGG